MKIEYLSKEELNEMKRYLSKEELSFTGMTAAGNKQCKKTINYVA